MEPIGQVGGSQVTISNAARILRFWWKAMGHAAAEGWPKSKALGSAEFLESGVTPKLRNAGEIPKVSGDQFQVVIHGSRRNLKIRIRKRLPGLL
jgi:hypothetical protein